MLKEGWQCLPGISELVLGSDCGIRVSRCWVPGIVTLVTATKGGGKQVLPLAKELGGERLCLLSPRNPPRGAVTKLYFIH